MAEIARTRTVAADPQRVWDVLADFGAINSWVEKVDHSCILIDGNEPIGTARRVQVGRDVLVERITEFDPARALACDIEGLPKRLRKVTNRWTLRPSGAATVVTLTTTVEIGPNPIQQVAQHVVCRVLARESDGMLAGLAKRVESAHV